MDKSIRAIAEGVTQLLSPYAEVVLHDIPSDTIREIFNPLSARKKGDPSLLDKDLIFEDGKTVYGPYRKQNGDGSFCKSISIVLEDPKGKARSLLCINLYVDALEKVQIALQSFTDTGSEKPRALFHFDWREKIHEFIHEYLRESGQSLHALSTSERRKLIRFLDKKNAFGAPNSHQVVAQIVGVSRATVFNDLKNSTGSGRLS